MEELGGGKPIVGKLDLTGSAITAVVSDCVVVELLPKIAIFVVCA